MNAQRKIKRLNSFLLERCGQNPLYAWIWSESSDFLHPVRVISGFDSSGQPTYEFNFRCPCGLNVRDHSPGCIEKGGISAEPVYVLRKIDDRPQGQWVLCALLPPPYSEAQFRQAFGYRLQYPRNGRWTPLSCSKGIFCSKKSQIPSFDVTVQLAKFINSGRDESLQEMDYEDLRALEKRDRKKREDIEMGLKDSMTQFSSIPGVRGNDSSYGGLGEDPVLRPKADETSELPSSSS